MNPALTQYKNAPSDNDRHSIIMREVASQPDHPLHEYSTIFEQVMAWGDMDIFQHLNNVRYYDYAQSARIDHMGRTGIFDKGNYTVIVATSCQYAHSVYFPDTLWIGVKVAKVGNTSLTHEYAYFSTAQQKIVATGLSTVVHMDKNGEKLPFSDEDKAVLAKF